MIMNKRNDFLKINNFIVYYGTGRVDRLKKADAVIIEPKGHTQKDIHILKEAGVLVLAYLSVVELPADHEDFQSFQKHFLQVNRQPVINKNFNTYYMDGMSSGWKMHLHTQADRLLQDQEYDGLFLDTVGDLENPILGSSIMFEQIHAYINFLKALREKRPQCLLVQNNGIEHVASYSKEYIDGICWENPSFVKKDKKWSEMILEKLIILQKEHHVKALLLIDREHDTKKVIKKAKKYKMVCSIAKKDYLEVSDDEEE